LAGNKSYASKAQNKGMGATKKIDSTSHPLTDYIFFYIESFDSFHLDLI